MLNVKVRGDYKKLENLPQKMVKAKDRVANFSNRQIKADIKENIEKYDLIASRKLFNSVTTKFVERNIYTTITETGSNLDYAEQVEFGRPKGIFPRVSDIAKWIAYKGFQASKNAAYFIARKIGNVGYKGRFPFKKAFESVTPKIIARFEQEFKKVL